MLRSYCVGVYRYDHLAEMVVAPNGLCACCGWLLPRMKKMTRSGTNPAHRSLGLGGIGPLAIS